MVVSMQSIKELVECIGINTSNTVSILFHLFGFVRARVPTDPCSSDTAQVSLLDHIESLKGQHIHLNIIRVGIDLFTDAEINRIDYGIYQTRKIFNPVNLGIGRVEHYNVASSNVDPDEDLGSLAEARDLINLWTVWNNGLDVFMVENISDPDGWVGWSPHIGGPVDKTANGTGIIGGRVNRNAESVARTLAHEIGHYLGLPHNHGDCDDTSCCPNTTTECNNLMAQTKCATSCGDGVCIGINLTSPQGSDIRSHGLVQDGC